MQKRSVFGKIVVKPSPETAAFALLVLSLSSYHKNGVRTPSPRQRQGERGATFRPPCELQYQRQAKGFS